MEVISDVPPEKAYAEYTPGQENDDDESTSSEKELESSGSDEEAKLKCGLFM